MCAHLSPRTSRRYLAHCAVDIVIWQWPWLFFPNAARSGARSLARVLVPPYRTHSLRTASFTQAALTTTYSVSQEFV